MIRNQHLPVLAFLLKASHHFFAPGFNADAAAGAPKGIGAGIDRISQDVQDRVVNRQFPLNHAIFGSVADRRQWDALMPKPEMYLTHRLHLDELGEDERDCLRNAPIRIFLDPVVANPHITDSNRHEELAPARLLLQGLKRTLAQHRQLHLTHGSLHAQQQPVVGMARIVGAVLV